MKNKRISFQHLGTREYSEVWDYQEKLFNGILEQKVANRSLLSEFQIPTSNYLLFVYHPHVYTLGKSGDLQNLLLALKELEELGIQFFRINRGGDITYHGPGQIVGYPILDLDNFFTDIHAYLRLLEEAVIRTCRDFGVNGGRINGLTGVWVDYQNPEKARKICALGVKASRWVTMHGFAFNVNTDLHYFQNIIPCGIQDKAVTSLKKELGKELAIEDVEKILLAHLVELFEFQLILANK